MMQIGSLNVLTDIARKNGSKRLVVAVAQDEDVLKAVKFAAQEGIIIPVLVGDGREIQRKAENAGFDLVNVELIHEPDFQNACQEAVRLIREGNAQLLMKGLVSTNILIKPILDKEKGLMTESLLSHIALFETEYYHKILCVTDAAVNISPGLEEKAGIIRNAVDAYHKLGIPRPKVGILAAVETVNPKIEATVHAEKLKEMQHHYGLDDCLIDGPFALDNAVSREAARHKGITSEVAGDVDILLTPDLNSGNILYKSLNFLGGASSAAVVTGASVPVVLTSRADSDRSKYLSIALAAALG
jgi:phosphate butyryltransferase